MDVSQSQPGTVPGLSWDYGGTIETEYINSSSDIQINYFSDPDGFEREFVVPPNPKNSAKGSRKPRNT